MKSKLPISFILFFTLIFRTSLFAQTTIAFQGFEGTVNDNWNFISPTQAAGAQPVLVGISNYGVGYAHTGNNSCRAGGGSTDCGTGSSNCLNNAASGGGCTNLANGAIIMFDTIDISCFSNVQIEVWHRSNTICVGAGFDASDNLKFEVSINGGAWTQIGLLSSANNYVWTYNDLVAGTSSTITNPLVYSAPIGAYTIAFRTNATVNRTDEVYYIDDVKITGSPSNLLMPSVTAIQPDCSTPTGSITINSPSFSGFTYSIDSIDFSNSTGVFSGLQPGNDYLVQVQSPAGCYSPVLTVSIDSTLNSSVNAVITALGSTQICSGDSVVLDASIGIANYQWQFNGIDVLNANSSTFSAFNPGNYQVIITSGTCIDTSAVMIVSSGISNPPSIASSTGNLSICNGDSLSLFVPNIFSTYQWLYNGTLIPNAQDSSFVVTTTGSYQLIVADLSGCLDTSAVIVVSTGLINPPIVTSNSGNLSICNGDSLTLFVPGLYNTYQWLLNGNIIPNANDSSFVVTTIGNYQLVVEGSSGCIDTSAVIVVSTGLINPPIVATNSGSFSICNGVSLTLFVTGLYNSYQWLINGNIIPNANDSSLIVTSIGNYQLIVNQTSGCIDTSVVQQVLISAPNPASISSSNGNFTICENQQINLNVPQNYTSYQWFNNNILIAGATTNSYTTASAGSYYIITQSSNGCYDSSATIQVAVIQTPNPIVSSSSTIICINQTATLQTSDFVSYQWSINNTPIANENNINFTTNQAGNYIVTVIDTNGCSGVSTPTIVSIDSVNVFINANAQSYCTGDTALLFASGSNYESLIWSTNFNGNNLLTNVPGTYSVIASNALGCTATASYNLSYTNQILIHASASDTTFTCDETIELYVTGADTYLWEPSIGLNDSTIYNPIVNGLTSFIIYTVTGTKGNCSAVDSVKIAYEACSSIFIPNAFSPNNDGANDIFRVLGSNIFEFNLKIYNRWGELVFESNKIDEGWDGKYKGKDVTNGVYVWLLDAKDANGKMINFNNKFSGNLNLFR
jgi:gliding motility-associated-like protein